MTPDPYRIFRHVPTESLQQILADLESMQPADRAAHAQVEAAARWTIEERQDR